MAVASARATSAATNDGCGWLEAETVASAAAQARYEDVWLAEHARGVPCALAAYRDSERHDEASRRAGVADPFTQATPTIRSSLYKPRLGQQASYLAPVQYQTPLPLCLTPLPCSPTPLPCSLTPLPCSPTPLPCLLACSPLLRSMIPSSPNPYQPHYRALPSDPIPSFLPYSTEYLPTLYLKCACHKHNDILLRPLRRLTYVMYVSFVVVNLLNRLS